MQGLKIKRRLPGCPFRFICDCSVKKSFCGGSPFQNMLIIWFIAHTFDFDGRKLQEAIMQTLQNRGTDYDRSSFDEIISFSENDAMLVKWRQFLRHTKLSNIEFNKVTALLNTFLGGIWKAIINEDEWLKNWSCQTTSW